MNTASNTQYLVSIIIAARNCEQTIKKTLKSISSQTYSNWECIIIDDCSTDNTRVIINNIIKSDLRYSIYYNESQLGAAKTGWHGIQLSKGKYIARLDADDIVKESWLELGIEYLEKYDKIGLVTFWHEVFNLNSQSSVKCNYPNKSQWIKWNLLFSNFIANSGTIWRKKFNQFYNI